MKTIIDSADNFTFAVIRDLQDTMNVYLSTNGSHQRPPQYRPGASSLLK